MEDLDPEPLLPPLRSEMMPKSSSIRTLSLPPRKVQAVSTYVRTSEAVRGLYFVVRLEREIEREAKALQTASLHSFIPLLSPLFPSMPATAVAV